MEYPSEFGTSEQAVVTATASVVSELWLRVPYPGKYAEAKLHINPKNIEAATTFQGFHCPNISVANAKKPSPLTEPLNSVL